MHRLFCRVNDETRLKCELEHASAKKAFLALSFDSKSPISQLKDEKYRTPITVCVRLHTATRAVSPWHIRRGWIVTIRFSYGVWRYQNQDE